MSKTMHELVAEGQDYLTALDADLRISDGDLFRMRETADLITNRAYRDGAALERLLTPAVALPTQADMLARYDTDRMQDDAHGEWLAQHIEALDDGMEL